MTARRRLLFFDFVTNFGGAQQSTVELCRQISRFHEVRVLDAYGVCEEYLSALRQGGVTSTIVLPHARQTYIGHEGNPILRGLRLIRQTGECLALGRGLTRHVLEISPDFVWTNSFKGLLFLSLTGIVKRFPVAFYVRGWHRRDQVPAWGRRLAARTAIVLAVSDATALALRGWGLDQDRIRVVPTVIDWDKVTQAGHATVLSDPPGKDRPCKILLPGQLTRTKGQHTAVEAARLLGEGGLDYTMWFCGGVKLGAGERYRQQLQDQIVASGLEDHVFLLGPRADVLALMRLADIVILPTHTEGLPRAVWEAQILERPVVSTPVGGVRDLIEHEKTGLLIPVEDGKALAEAILRLHSDKALTDRLVRRAKARVMEEYAPDRSIASFNAAVEETYEKKT